LAWTQRNAREPIGVVLNDSKGRPVADGEIVLEVRGMTAADCVRRPENVIVGFVTREARAVRPTVGNDATPLDVIPDPWPRDVPDAVHRRNEAHALITGWEGLGKNVRLRAQRALSTLDSLFWAYP
jgi:hypothetical protein